MMTNHVHPIAIPAREDSLAVLLRRVHGRDAQYYNTRSGPTGHLRQNRFFACVLGEDHFQNVAKTALGLAVLGVIDCSSPEDVKTSEEAERRAFLRRIGHKG